MTIEFTLKLEPFSVNRMYYRDRRHKSQDYRDWELAVLQAMRATSVQQELAKIRDAYNEALHYFEVELNYVFPKEVLYNKKGLLSSRAEDLTNIEKPLIDLLFLPKIHIQPAPYGVPNLNTDDKNILKLVSCKSAGTSYEIQIKIALHLLPDQRI